MIMISSHQGQKNRAANMRMPRSGRGNLTRNVERPEQYCRSATKSTCVTFVNVHRQRMTMGDDLLPI